VVSTLLRSRAGYARLRRVEGVMIDPGLQDRTVLITGGNNPFGIGAATAQAFAAQGAGVLVHFYRQRYESGEVEPDQPGMPFFMLQQSKTASEVIEAIRSQGGRADSWECDLSEEGVIPELFDRAEQALGPVDVLVNNAADYQADTLLPQPAGPRGDELLWDEGPAVSTISASSHDRHFAVNSRAAALTMAEFARRYSERGGSWGRIVNVSADCSWGCPAEISYRASKHALESYSRSAAAELGPLGITVNVVCPGPVQTGYIAASLESALIQEIPLRRVGRPEDIADAILFLASDQASWLTGQVITVHGGHRMALGR
jgi:3-oxoacyl-[acyl-carrier protein] reductase